MTAPNRAKPLRVLDLFSGIGGFSRGLERTAGFETVAFCAIEPFQRSVLAKHWPGVKCYHDVRELNAQRLTADGIICDVIIGGAPARISASPGKAPDWAARGRAYGASSPVLLARYDPASLSWKTSQHCLDGGLETFSETWPRSGTMRNGTAYRLPPLAPLTAETGSGSWRPPDASMCSGGAANAEDRVRQGHAASLADQVNTPSMWPTPRREDGESTGMSAKRLETREPDNLPTAVRLWPTIAARDYRAPNAPGGASRLSRPPTSGEQLPNAVGGVLNPEWVELLMGYPTDYTDTPWKPSRGKATRPEQSPKATPTAGFG